MSALEVVRCDKCGVNLVPREVTTPEQEWCGAWWDHPIPEGGRESLIGHTGSALFPSPELRAAL